jgi:hypothetical protein
MEEIKEFLDDFIKAEEIASREFRKKDNIEEYNIAVENLDSFTFLASKDFSKIGFNHRMMTNPHSDDFFDELPLMEEITPREIYKISYYHNDIYNDLWACYLSIANAYNGIKRIHDCLIVVKINEEFKIIAKYSQDIDQPTKWKCYGGDRELKIDNLGKLQSIECYLEPIDDVWSMEEYRKDI